MPIYAYRCEACGHELDALQKLSDAPLTDCPACGAAALKKQLTAPAFRLKGTGWYETDFKKDGKRNLHEGGDAPKSGDGAAASGKDAATSSAKDVQPKSGTEAAPKTENKTGTKPDAKPAAATTAPKASAI